METSTTDATPVTRPGVAGGKNHTHNGHYSRQHIHTPNRETVPPTTILIIVVPIIIVILLFSISLIIIMLRRLKPAKSSGSHTSNSNCMFIAHSTTNFNSSPEVKGGCLYGGTSRQPAVRFKGVQVFTYRELEAATDKFSSVNVIGNGGFEVVYRGILIDGTVAAIKVLHREGKQGERAFRLEVDLLSRLQCPHLVELLGYCADQHHRLLIFEFMPNGTLQQHLHPSNKRSQPLNWGTRLKIALDCARALEFLHEHTTPSVIHRDFKCTNVLLDQNLRAKVSDFGLAKIGSEKMNGLISTRVLGTTGYLAPE